MNIFSSKIMSARLLHLIWLKNLKYFHSLKINSFMTRHLSIHNGISFQIHMFNSTQTTIDTPFWIKTTVDKEIYNAPSVTDILSLADNDQVNYLQAASVIITMCEKFGKDTKLQNINGNPQFKKLCQLLDKNMEYMNHKPLLLLYRSMLLLNVPSSEHVLVSLQNQVLWKLRKMKISEVIKLVNLQLQYQRMPLDLQILNESIATISRRWVEIVDVKDLILLMNYFGNFTEDFQSKLENRALELVDKMTIDDFQKLVSGIANQQHRPTPLLRAVSYYIMHRQMALSVKDIVSLIHSLKRLRYYDQALLECVSQNLVNKLPLIEKSSQISIILMSFGQMKWRHPSLLSMLSFWLIEHIESCPLQHLTPFILTSASINYLPDSSDQLLNDIVKKLKLESLDKHILIDIAWSLAILERLPLEIADQVLQPDSYKYLKGDSSFEGSSNKLKLLNIQTAAKLEVPGYSGKNITEIYSPDNRITVSKSKEVLRKSVLSSLTNFIPSENNLRSNVTTPFGYTLDAEFLVSKDIRPLQYDKYPSGEELPNGVYRVAVLVWDFNDFTQFSTELIGINAMAVRHLTKLGYHILQVPYMEYNEHKTVIDRVQYLQNKLKEVINPKPVNKKQL